MVQKGEVYVCDVCGIMVRVIRPGGGLLVCCGKEMRLVEDERGEAGSG